MARTRPEVYFIDAIFAHAAPDNMTENIWDTQKMDINAIADRGTEIYESVKEEYEPEHTGKFAAVDIGSEEIFLGNESIDALDLARRAHPGNVFYVLRIGFDSTETMAHALLKPM